MEKAKIVARWIVFAPAAVLAAAVTPALTKLFFYVGVWFSDGLLVQATAEGAAGFYCGVVFVWVAATVAPSRQRQVALTMAAIGLVIAGAGEFANVLTSNWWGLWQGAWCAVGAAFIAYRVIGGELFPEPIPRALDRAAA